jgi:hypothetical protein
MDALVEWLLDSDPAIRWQVVRDLIDASEAEVTAERACIAHEGGAPSSRASSVPTATPPRSNPTPRPGGGPRGGLQTSQCQLHEETDAPHWVLEWIRSAGSATAYMVTWRAVLPACCDSGWNVGREG